MENSEGQWTWGRAMARAEERLRGRGLIRLSRPVQEFGDLGEITEIEALGEVGLANMMLRHQAWYAFATVELAYAKAALSSFDEVYDVRLGEQMHRIGKSKDSRVVKDVLKSLAIQENEELKGLHRLRIEKMQEQMLLEGMVKGLEIRCRALENESIRRASVRKVEMH